MVFGFAVYGMDGEEIFCKNGSCGKCGSSNIAEYRAIIVGLEACLSYGVDTIHVYTDSQLAVRQITGSLNANNEILKKHQVKALELLESFYEYTIDWIPRKENKRADALVGEVFAKRFNKCKKKKKR